MNVGDCGVKCRKSGTKWFKSPSRGLKWIAKHSDKEKKEEKTDLRTEKREKNKRNNKKKSKEKRRR